MKINKLNLLTALIAIALLFAATFIFTNSDGSPIADPMAFEQDHTTAPADAIDTAAITASYGKLPINFEPNIGQAAEPVRFLAHGRGYLFELGDDGARVTLQKPASPGKEPVSARIGWRIESPGPVPTLIGIDPTASKTNYLVGNDPSQWHSDIANYARVKSKQVIPGVDAVYYGNGQQLEYDLVVAPGTDPGNIRMHISGINHASIDKQTGDLVLETAAGPLRQLCPIVYQNTASGKNEVPAFYHLEGKNGDYTVSFRVGDYDASKELIIDPVLAYGSYLGGLGFEEGRGIAVDALGNVYVVGTTASLNFPTTPGTVKPVLLPRTDAPNSYWYDAFVTKINPAGTGIVFSTYYGGRSGSETGTGVAVTPAGEIIISGTTTAGDLPVVNAFQPTFGGTDDAFAARLNTTGSAIVYSTYLGGNNTDTGGHIGLNPTTGDAVFAGHASSPNFPTSPGAYRQRLCDSPITCNGIFYSGSYVVRLTAAGNLVYSTLFDASINDVGFDANDNALIAGSVGTTNFPTTAGAFQPASSGGIEGFIAKLNPAGNALVYGTYLGGGLQSDVVNGVTLDAAGNIYVTGQTQSTAFPVTAGAFDTTYNGGEDGFVTKLDASGSALIFSTYFGGQGKDQPFAIAVGPGGSVFIAGETLGGGTLPLRNSLIGATGSIFVTRFNGDASALVYSTLLGNGGAYALAVDGAGNAYVTGHTTNVVVTPTSFQPMHGVTDQADPMSSPKDAFVAKLATVNEDAVSYAISGTVTDDNYGYNNDYTPIVVTISGTVNRSYSPPSGGSGTVSYYFGNLPPGGDYTIAARKAGYDTDPQSAGFNGLGANQFADFHILHNHAPEGIITSPAHGTNYNAPATIAINATATDPDGDAIQKVDFVAYNSITGSTPIGSDTTAPYTVTWSNVPVGTHALYAIPTDSHGLRGISTPVVHVFVVDPATPSVNITSPAEGQTFAEGDEVPLSANVSSSITVLEFLDQNNTIIGRRINAPWASTWRVLYPGNYTITAKGYTSQGSSVMSEPVHITVNRINHRISGTIVDSISNAPVSGATVTLVCPSTPTISASTTTDAGGNYVFTDLGTTPNDSVTITPTLAGYSFDPPNRSTGYLGYLRDWSNQNYLAVHATGITVNMTGPTDGQTFTAPAGFNLTAAAASTAGAVTKVEFYQQGFEPLLLGTDTAAPFELPLSAIGAGSYGYFARATDSTGGVTDSATIHVTVVPPVTSVRLQGEVHNPGGGPMVGITVRLTGTAGGYAVNQTSVSNLNGSYGFFNLAAGGNYTIAPEAVNTTFTPPSASFTNVVADVFDINFVASAANQAPSVLFNSPADGASFTMPAGVPISATATDVDGSIIHLQITAQSRTMATTIGQSNNGNIAFTWQPNLPGTYTLYASARDNGGLVTSTSITIIVNQPGGVAISGRIVDRNSHGVEGVTVELKDLATEATVIGSALTDANGNYSIANVTTFENYVLRAAKTNYSFSPQKRTYINLAANQPAADYTGTLQVQPSDFDGNGESDLAVWRPSTGVWYVDRSTTSGYSAVLFGGAAFGDIVVPGNYDGDKKIDYAVYRNGTWYIMNSTDGSVRVFQFGMADDKPVPADFDGDGKTDIAVWRPSTGVWYIARSSDGGYDYKLFGTAGDTPVTGDYDGDGMADQAVWRPSNGTWYVLQSSDAGTPGAVFGALGDIPLAGDFDGDKRTDYAVFRPGDGTWYVLKSSDNAPLYIRWGISGDKPVPGDYDRDGKTDIAIFRPSDSTWYLLRSTDGSFYGKTFGAAGDIPVASAYSH